MSALELNPGSAPATKTGGLLAVAVVLIGGFLRIVIPSGPAPTASVPTNPSTKASSPQATPENVFAKAIKAKIKESFGCSESAAPSAADDDLHWNVPSQSRSNAHFIVAFVPDPVHTHLSLLFDRDVEAMQLAVPQIASKIGGASQNFVFDRAILPWKIPSHEPADAIPAAEKAKDRERYPGLLIFRKTGNGEPTSTTSQDSTACPARETLFVFLVAETPTSGIRATQFQNALMIMNRIRGAAESGAKAKSPPLLLLGPNFSGSLDSLGRQLKQILPAHNFSDVIAYSGSITGAQTADAFRQSFPPPTEQDRLNVRFASFQESDEYALQMFARFAYCRGYAPGEIAVLSEADTVYGNQKQSPNTQEDGSKDQAKAGDTKPDFANSPTACNGPAEDGDFKKNVADIVHLNFPREIAYFRSAYEKQLAAQAQPQVKLPGKTTLPMETGDDGNDDDEVAHYANGQSSLSQEAVMLGLVSELQKHHVKFTILMATNPVDQVFLARYLRTNYPQGRVVVTSPDLMLASQEDTLLTGVLGLNDYSLVPGLGDSLCHLPSDAEPPRPDSPTDSEPHVDRLFDSNISIGIYNAMLGLATIATKDVDADSYKDSYSVPLAPYVAYTPPALFDGDSTDCAHRPLLWLTILGRDGYWPIAALTKDSVTSDSHSLPIVTTSETLGRQSALPKVSTTIPPAEEKPLHTVPAWKVVYALCVAALVLHLVLSLTGTFLSNSESKAQFARSHDRLGVIVLALGAFWLSTCFVLLACTRNPRISWQNDPHGLLTLIVWLPLPIFVALTVYDIAWLRKQPVIAWSFAGAVTAVTAFHLLLLFDCIPHIPYAWSSRLIHFSSGVSPVLPFLLLFASGYWWAWLSLRSVSLVDLRRPRLPSASMLSQASVRISDTEAENVRNTAHPLKVGWRIVVILTGVLGVSMTTLELGHPLQSLEGDVYDRGYSVALAVVIAVFLGCLFRLVFTWYDYKQILSGLDRSPLREAFSRMKRLSWRSMWNPGGSTLRETYRVMSRTLENMGRLKEALDDEKSKLGATPSRQNAAAEKIATADAILGQIAETTNKVSVVQRIFRPLFPRPQDLPAAPGGDSDPFMSKIDGGLRTVEEALAKYDSAIVSRGVSSPDAAKAVEKIKCSQGKLTLALEKYRLVKGKTNNGAILRSDSAHVKPGESQSSQERFTSSVEELKTFLAKNSDGNGLNLNILAGLFAIVSAAEESLVTILTKNVDALSEGQDKQPAHKPEMPCKDDQAALLAGLVESLEVLQKQLANTAGVVLKRFLEPLWAAEKLPAISEDERIKRPELEMMRAIAEEFVALVYVNFLQSVLLQMRSLVICAGGVYVFLLMSMSVYPFEPHPALQVLGVALVVVMAAAVGFVYAEMHRDPILSRLTSTTAGELGWEFWFKFISAGAIPVFSLLAVQFPEIGRFLFSWLEPALQAVK